MNYFSRDEITMLNGDIRPVPFLKVFRSVGIFKEMDKGLYQKGEDEFLTLLDIVPLDKIVKSSVTLKVVKFYDNKFEGYYDSPNKEIVIGVNRTNSFVHEIGHLIDGELTEGDKWHSSTENFSEIYHKYVDNFLTYNQVEDPNYILKPWEVFARCFEQYIAYHFPDIETIGYSLDELAIIAQPCNYPIELLDDVIEFFDNLFTLYK